MIRMFAALARLAGSAARLASLAMADGEIRKVDKEASKLTRRHGALIDLSMPPMTMMFRVQEVAMLSQVATGDPVRFTAVRWPSALIVATFESVK